MKIIETLRIAATARYRAARARVMPGGYPARLVLRVDDLDAAVPMGAVALDVEGWQEHIVGLIQSAGPMPAELVSRPDAEVLPELIRFCHRLEMPTRLRTCARGMTEAKAEELVDRGLSAAVVRIAGTTDAVQATLGETAEDAAAAMSALLRARHTRGGDLHVYVEIPFGPESAAGLKETWTWVKSLGADGVYVAAPWHGRAVTPEMVDATKWLGRQFGPFSRTPRASLSHLTGGGDGRPGIHGVVGECPVAARRIELDAAGTWRACPFQPGEAHGPFAGAWIAMADHRKHISTCPRACAHPSLTGE